MNNEAYKMFESILGPENVSQDPGVLDSYTYQWMGEMTGDDVTRFGPFRPACVALPSTTGWGLYSSPGREGVVQLDLRRMNRLIEINEKDMYAVVEPYVIWAQLQVEAMRKGLNCVTIGAGSGTSALANCTSHNLIWDLYNAAIHGHGGGLA